MKQEPGKKVGRDLTQGSVLGGLITFVLPMILASLIQQIYSVVDLVIIGKFVGNVGTVGVSTGGEFVDMILPVAMAFSMAGQIYIAQLSGAKIEYKLKEAIGTFLSLMMIFALVLMAGTLVFNKQILELLNCPPEAFSQAQDYMILTGIGIPFIFGYNAICGILRGMGESKRPLFFIAIAAVVNIFLDLLLVVVIPMQAAGTAIATSVSQAASFFAALFFMQKNKESFGLEFKRSYFKLKKEHIKVILAFGIPQATRSLLVRVSVFWVNASVNSYGLVVSATNSVGNKLQKFLDIYSGGFSQASSATIGQNLGAKKPERAKKVVYYSCIICLCLASLVTAAIVFVPRTIFGVFTNDNAVMNMGVDFLRIMIIHFYASAAISAFQAMVIGSGNSILNFVIGILDGVICKIGLSIIFANVMGMGAYGYFWGISLSRALPCLICMFYFFSGMWNRRKLLVDEDNQGGKK
jgi:putative MATE family efflux protein